jgi:hypothetical protein
MDSATDWVPGRIGNALDFDGVDDYVTISDNPSLNLNQYQIGIYMDLCLNSAGFTLALV